MSGSARIDSIEALKNLRTFLSIFAKKISVSLEEADFDIRQTLHWLQHDRGPYWKNEVRIRSEQLVKAKLALKSKKYFENSAVSGHSSFIDEKKALAAAQKRFEEAEDKLNKVRSWIPKLEKEGDDCRVLLQGMSNFIHVDLPNKRTQIDNMIIALESYVNVSTPLTAASTEPVITDEMSAAFNMPKEMQPALDMELLCKDLRQREPLKNVSTGVLTQGPLLNIFTRLTLSNAISEIIEKNRTDISGFSENSKVAFDNSVENSDFIYLQHLASTENAEIKWYIGNVKAEESAHCRVCKMSDFLQVNSEFEAILALPEGWLIILRNGALEAVVNAENKMVAVK